MSAPIVYQGDVAGEGGTLFKGNKFWVAQRVPMRKTWVDNIKTNGGQVVPLEKNADFMIADHVRRDAPQGSYSWKWIEDSVKKGKLLDRDNYLIGKPEEQKRQVGPSAPTKGTRTPFTAEDDRVLMEWVLKCERGGEPILGNAIYQKLAEKNPRHTSQSWRDRWVKKLSMKPRPNIPIEELEAQDAEKPQPSPINYEKKLKSRIKFTAEEDRQLKNYVLEHTEKTGHDRGNKIYKEYAEEFPQHTWQAYRDRWIKYLRPDDEDEEEEEEEEETTRARSRRSKTNAIQSARDERPDVALETAQEKPESSRDESRSVTQPQDASTSASTGHVRRSPRHEKKLEIPVEVDQQPNDENEQEGSRNMRTSAAGDNDELLPSEADLVDSFSLSREQFNQDYRAFLNVNAHIRPNFWPTVRGQSFDLWDLWRHAVSQRVDSAERDWQQIAENIGYNWVEHDGVEDEIRQVYEDHLAEFENELVNFDRDESDDTDTDGDEDVSDEAAAVVHVSEAPDRNSEVQWNSSPPKQPSLKRTHEAALLSDQLYPDSSGKRLRVNKDSEIPSTPDTKNGTAHLRRPVSAAVSPSDRILSALPKSSRAQQSAHKNQGFTVNADQTSTNGSKVHSKGRVVEPETQDFRYDPETQNLVFDTEMDDAEEESQINMTPSQQLHRESEAGSSPVKFVNRTLSGPSTPTPKRKDGISAFVDSPDDEHDQLTPKARFGKGKNPLLADLERKKQQQQPTASSPKSRSSIVSQSKPHPPPVSRPETSHPPPPSFPSSSAASKRAKPSHTSLRKPQAPQEPAPAAAPVPPPSSIAADPVASEIAKLHKAIDYWVALGYAPAIARRALEATTWMRDKTGIPDITGIVGEVMELLRDGQPLPTHWQGVWTAKDDEKLLFLQQQQQQQDITDDAQAKKTDKKRLKYEQHLMNKHGKEQIALRKRWFEKKERLRWGDIE